MAGTCTSFSPHAIGSGIIESSRPNRNGAPFCLRFAATGRGSPMCNAREPTTEGPSCIFVGPLETASKETLEALYSQAREAYYSGKPLIVDDMFDRVELKLRSYGSKSVLKYPRCSLRRQSAYADAEEDPAQVFALASIWILILGFGSSVCLVPIIYTAILAYQDAFGPGNLYNSQTRTFEFLGMVSAVLFVALGSVVGCPIASASIKVLQGLWKNDLVALRGVCPNCGEEVFAFVQSNQSMSSPHRSDCHVCECCLEFCTKVEPSISRLGRNWVHGRIYLVSQSGKSRRQRWL